MCSFLSVFPIWPRVPWGKDWALFMITSPTLAQYPKHRRHTINVPREKSNRTVLFSCYYCQHSGCGSPGINSRHSQFLVQVLSLNYHETGHLISLQWPAHSTGWKLLLLHHSLCQWLCVLTTHIPFLSLHSPSHVPVLWNGSERPPMTPQYMPNRDPMFLTTGPCLSKCSSYHCSPVVSWDNCVHLVSVFILFNKHLFKNTPSLCHSWIPFLPLSSEKVQPHHSSASPHVVWYSLQTSGSSITWDLVRNANSHPTPTEPETLGLETASEFHQGLWVIWIHAQVWKPLG